MKYNPNPKTAEILNYSMSLINSVPYKVTRRWLFYRLVQKGYLRKTSDDPKISNKKKVAMEQNKLTQWLSKARKRFWNGWDPTTLYDDTREVYIKGLPREARPALPDLIAPQKNYVEIWCEAAAMISQFLYITEKRNVTVLTFRGATSISFKWDIAKRLEKRYEQYKKPIVILYFGDCDKKGREIPRDALNDIRAWCSAPFEFVYCGLTLKQALLFKLDKNPDSNKPDDYQWEAIGSEQAEDLILSNLDRYWD